jgi:hypothetical protein
VSINQAIKDLAACQYLLAHKSIGSTTEHIGDGSAVVESNREISLDTGGAEVAELRLVCLNFSFFFLCTVLICCGFGESESLACDFMIARQRRSITRNE